MDDECHCPSCDPPRPDVDYLWEFYQWIQRIDPRVIEVFDATYGDNELTMN